VEGKKEIKGATGKQTLQFGVSTLPDLPQDDSDRNRTSPFAFTGNKFEFRAVGSSESIATPNTVLNAMVTESLDYMATEIEKSMMKGMDINAAAEQVVRDTLKEHKHILFNGDNYSEEWHAEAERRGIPNLKDTVASLPQFISDETKALFKKYAILDENELVSRYNVRIAAYCKTLNIEWQMTKSIANTMILPAALEYQSRIANAIVATKAAVSGINTSVQENLLRDVTDKISELKLALERLDASIGGNGGHGHGEGESYIMAQFYADQVIPAMAEVRNAADELEVIVDDALWPLPKFREILYIY
jgi:glutamine synthetase